MTVARPAGLPAPLRGRMSEEDSGAVVCSAGSGSTVQSTVAPHARIGARYGEVTIKVITNLSGSTAACRVSGDLMS